MRVEFHQVLRLEQRGGRQRAGESVPFQIEVLQERQVREVRVRDRALERVLMHDHRAQRRNLRKYRRQLPLELVPREVQVLQLREALERARELALELVRAQVQGFELGQLRDRARDVAFERVLTQPEMFQLLQTRDRLRHRPGELVLRQVQEPQVLALNDRLRDLAGEPRVRERELLEVFQLADPGWKFSLDVVVSAERQPRERLHPRPLARYLAGQLVLHL